MINIRKSKVTLEMPANYSTEVFGFGNVERFLDTVGEPKKIYEYIMKRAEMQDPSYTKMFKDAKRSYPVFKDGLDDMFARNGYELWDTYPHAPLSAFFRQGQVPARIGGGYAEWVSAFRYNVAVAKGRLMGDETNELNLVNVIEEKLSVPAYAFGFKSVLSLFEDIRSRQIGYNRYDGKLLAVRLSYQKELEEFAFTGNLGIGPITSENHPDFVGGLFNQKEENILGSEVLDKHWETLTFDEWLDKFNSIAMSSLVAFQYDYSKIFNMVILPPELIALFERPAIAGRVSDAGGIGIYETWLDYFERSLSNLLNQNVIFVQNPYLSGRPEYRNTTAGIVAAGVNDTGRIVFGRYDEDVYRTNITMPLFSTPLTWDGGRLSSSQAHIAICTPLMVIYPSIYYLDNAPLEYVSLTLPSGVTSNVANPNQIIKGTNVELTINVPSGETLASLTVNGENKTSEVVNNKYTFTIEEDTTVAVVFE